MLKLYRVARTEAQPGTRGYTAPTRVLISCHSCHGHYLHIVIAGSVKDYYYYYYYDYDNKITNAGYNLLHLYSYNVFTIRLQPAYMCQMSPDICHYQYMTDILEPGQFTIFCEIKVFKKRTAMTNRQCLYAANSLNTFCKDSQTAAAATAAATTTNKQQLRQYRQLHRPVKWSEGTESVKDTKGTTLALGIFVQGEGKNADGRNM